MNPSYAAYRLMSSGLFLMLFPTVGLYRRIAPKHRLCLDQRMGRYPEAWVRSLTGRPRIWLHAASVGEVGVAMPVMRALSRRMPACRFILSTTTAHGQASARSRAGSETRCVYAPVDFTAAVRSALSAFRPDILMLLETEIWPNWLAQARRMGVKTALVNGRISVRSLRGYLRARGIIRETLSHVDAFSMIHPSDAGRIRRIGAPAEKISVNGNAKYDLLIRGADPQQRRRMQRLYRLEPGQPAFVAGSTRRGEEAIVLDVFGRAIERLPEAVMIAAPRPVARAPRIRERARRRGFTCQMRTALDGKGCERTASVVVLDTIGELPAVYSMASVAFCGGSLVPLGGQNVLEAAVWGRPVLYGPSMEDFQDARMLLEKTGGGVQVASGGMLAEKVLGDLADPGLADAVGRRARKAVESHAGAAGKHADVICRLLGT